MKRNFKWMLVAILTLCGATNVYAEDDFTVTRLSNPSFTEGQLDGYLEGGVHGNDYTQSMVALGDNVFIATCANLGYAFTRRYNPRFNFWYIAEELYNGRFPFYDPEYPEGYDGARIIAYNTKTKKFKVIYEGENGVGYRSAATDGTFAYFSAYSADSRVNPYILKVTKSGEVTKLFETRDCVALHANCVYEGRVYFGGADEREDVSSLTVKPAKLAVLAVHSATLNRVADYKDFGVAAYDEIFNYWNDSPIWSMANHNGYIYVTLPGSAGFVVFRGRPATDAEKNSTPKKANAYGWVWEEVAGLNNIYGNNPGLSNNAEGDPGTITMLSGSVYEFNGKLYAYNFDHSIMGELSVFYNTVKTMSEEPKALDYLEFVYTLLQNPQKVWCLNDVTGKFEPQFKFTQNMLCTLNGRMTDFNDQLYVASIDAGHIYILLSQLATDDFIHMTPREIIAKLINIEDLLQSLTRRKVQDQQTQELIEQLGQLESFLLGFLKNEVDNVSEDTNITDVVSLEDILKLIGLVNGADTDLKTSISDLLKLIGESGILGAADATGTIDTDWLANLLELFGLKDLFDLDKITDIANLPTEDWKTFLNAVIVKLLQDKLGIGDDVTLPDFDLSTLTQYQELLESILELIKDKLGDIVNLDEAGENIADVIFYALLEGIRGQINGLLDRLETGAIGNYAYIYNRLRQNEWGFDLMRTSDGREFEFITRNGFGDKFNYGCPSFAATADALYIGTSNSFYGGQLYKLTKNTPAAPGFFSTDANDADAIQSITSEATQLGNYTLDGRRVNGKLQKGLYIQNGKKVLVK